MAVITFKIAGRPYKIACADGQESHILELSRFLDAKATALTKNIGFIPEGQLLAMVSILVAEELFNGKKAPESSSPASTESANDQQVTQIIGNLAIRISELAEVLKKS